MHQNDDSQSGISDKSNSYPRFRKNCSFIEQKSIKTVRAIRISRENTDCRKSIETISWATLEAPIGWPNNYWPNNYWPNLFKSPKRKTRHVVWRCIRLNNFRSICQCLLVSQVKIDGLMKTIKIDFYGDHSGPTKFIQNSEYIWK